MPQIADYLMATIILITIVDTLFKGVKIERKYARFIGLLFLFVTYILLVSTIWSYLESSFELFLYPVYYLYNSLVIFVIFRIYQKKRDTFLKITFYAIGFSGIVLILIYLMGLGDVQGIRQTLTFNNPNQLGYYALVSGAIIALIAKTEKLSMKVATPFLTLFFFFTLLSLSKSAIISYLLLLIINFVKSKYLAFSFAIISLVVIQLFNLSPLQNEVESRFSSIGKQSDDSLEGRGYYRVVNYPQYLLFGAAEGAAENRSYYNPDISSFGGEFHSSWGTIVFSYGIIGAIIFYLIIYSIAKNNLAYFMYFVPIFAYGFVHQGLRFTQLWILLGLLYLSKDKFFKI